MEAAPFASDETGRLFALQELRLLDTPPEARFDRVVQLAARLGGTPIGIFSVVAERNVLFKAVWGAKQVGLQLGQPSREYWFCSHVVASGRPLMVANARVDERFCDIASVASTPGLVAYAGVRSHAPGGEILGALAVFDTEVREFPDSELSDLAELATLIETELSPLPYVTTDALTGTMNARISSASATGCWPSAIEEAGPRSCCALTWRDSGTSTGRAAKSWAIAPSSRQHKCSSEPCVAPTSWAVSGPTSSASCSIGADAKAARLVIDRIVVHAIEYNRTSGNPYSLAFHLGGAVHLPGEVGDVAGLLVTAAPQRAGARLRRRQPQPEMPPGETGCFSERDSGASMPGEGMIGPMQHRSEDTD